MGLNEPGSTKKCERETWLITIGPGNSEAGWGFNNYHSGLTVAAANVLPEPILRTNSFFACFDEEELYGPNGSTIAATPDLFRRLLADAIPALSNPMGRGPITGFGTVSRDLDTMRRGAHFIGDWPRPSDRWLHSDIKDIAYPFNYNVFDNIVMDGGLR